MRELRWSVPLLGFAACHYDLEPLYEQERPDAGDDAASGDAAELLRSAQLISAWIGHQPSVDETCVRCAEERCGDVDSSCRADPDCVAYTDCVGAKPHPAGLTECRAQFSGWVRATNVRDRDLTGPYGQCVFRDRCAIECGGNSDLTCRGKYSWTTTSEASVPLHLYLGNAFDAATPPAGVGVKVCSETSCPNEVTATSEENGLVELSLPITTFARGFNGFLELQAPTILPSLLKFSWNIASETTQMVNVVPFMPGDNAPDRGMLQLRMFGCGGLGVRGVSFEAEGADSLSRSWYYDNGLSYEATATSPVGSGGITNMPIPTRAATLVTALQRQGELSEVVARADAPLRAGFMTVVVFVPGPAQ